MVIIIKQGTSKKKLELLLKKLKTKNLGFNPDKYNGAVKFKQDGLILQTELRDGWERTVNRH